MASGGGIKTNKLVRPGLRGGSGSADRINPGAVARMGAHIGNHAMESGTVKVRPAPLVAGQAPAVPLGNTMTKTKPTVMRNGTQGRH